MAGNGDKGDKAIKFIATAGLSAGVGALVVSLFQKRPVAAAPDEEKWDYLFELQQTIIQLLGQLIDAHKDLEVSVSTLWVAKTPEHIFDQAIRNIGIFESDKMIDYSNSKRLLIKVESSLDQACNIQVVGDFVNSFQNATNIGAAWPCVANSNISIGLAWDDWHPYIGVRITTAVAPIAGKLDIWTVLQD